MPHTARIRSESKFYHVVPKGIADQLIFEGDGDRRYYLNLLAKAKSKTGIRIHAYCLMSNHVHLIVEDVHDQISQAMKLVHERYGSYYAEKIGRTGGIFRKPFWSEPIDTDAHFLCAVRYVHANPAAAGVCPASAYEWSSVKDYLGRRGLTDTTMVLGMLGGQEGFVAFSQAVLSTALPFEGSRLRNHLSDDDAARLAKDILGIDTLSLASACRKDQVTSVRVLKRRGFTTRQISRISGIGKSTVQNYLA